MHRHVLVCLSYFSKVKVGIFSVFSFGAQYAYSKKVEQPSVVESLIDGD